MDFILRKAGPADADACGRVHYESWVETYTGMANDAFWERASAERSIENWRQWLDDGRDNGLDATIAEVDGVVVGLAFARASRENYGFAPVRDLELYTLYVLRAYHGTGIGQALLDAVVPPGTPAQLWAAEHNPRSRAFYERNGFRTDGATDSGESFGGIAAVRMVR
ncbi:GNAT family N-acetyltransferase [Antribacter gilvus]|uniref:GNAT family N-acetyltransferase n=1 Tax=Antribacter gilvus TaxID=2304675 RepID=UPI001F0B7BA5|nr:GNAT family N-acetyltransferase [Antribacter gilvus]